MLRRTPRALLLALLIGCALSATISGSAAAANGVDVRGSTTYTLVPEAGVVRVSVRLTVRNVTADTSRVRYYYTGYGVGVQTEATAIKASRGGRTLRTTVSRARGYKVVNVQFGSRLFRGQSIAFRVDFDLPDGGARSKSTIRVGRAFAGFYGYAYGEEAADVRIVLPAGFKVSTREGQPLTSSRDSTGRTVLAASRIAKPSGWWAFVAAERDNALREETLAVSIGGQPKQVTVKSWPEDAKWRETVRNRLERGLPILGELIGLPWPVQGTLEVREVFTPLLGGYAGIYYQPSSEIRITEDPDELVVLHESSHGWFNGDLSTERWINEGLADEYASRALAGIGSQRYTPDPVTRTARYAFALNAWPAPRPVQDEQTDQTEQYGYDASWHVIHQLVGEIGEERMRDVLKAAANDEIAYVGEVTPETRSTVGGANWRTFLDLLEERGGSRTASAVFRQWVIAAGDVASLDRRAVTRDAYAKLIDRGGSWKPPYTLRVQMADWQFTTASNVIKVASATLEARDQIATLAQTAGVRTTSTLENAYERNGDPNAAQRLATDQLTTLQSVARARQRVEAERPPITILGLLGNSPDAALGEARQDYERDDLPGAREAATRALALLDRAPGLGTERLAVVIVAIGIVIVASTSLLVVQRRRRLVVAAPATVAPREATRVIVVPAEPANAQRESSADFLTTPSPSRVVTTEVSRPADTLPPTSEDSQEGQR